MSKEVFCHLSLTNIADLIQNSRRKVIIASPGIDDGVASAISNAVMKLGLGSVQVILDVDESNCRAGYGSIDGTMTLVDKGIQIRRCQGLRIGFLLVDDVGFIFGQVPYMVESPSKLTNCPNAVRASPEQIRSLEAATRPPPSATDISGQSVVGKTPADPHAVSSLPKVGADPPDDGRISMPTTDALPPAIGQTFVSPAEVKRIDVSIRSNPVQNFDLSRVVNVFAAYIQFVELTVSGANLETHTVKLPPELMTTIKDRETRDRLTTAFKMVSENSRLSGDTLRAEASAIRKKFIRVNPTYGGVILKAKREELEADILKLKASLERHKKAVRDRFLKEAAKSKSELVMALWRNVRAQPPADLLIQISNTKPTMDEAKAYLTAKLDDVFPDAEKVCEGMKVDFVTKDVTWETLNSPNFVEWLSKQFPANAALKKPFEEFRAAREQQAASSAQGKQPRK